MPGTRIALMAAILLGGFSVAFSADKTTNVTTHPIMHFTAEQKKKLMDEHLRAPKQSVNKALAPSFANSLTLLSHLPYVPADRDQGSCGDCWQWAATGAMEILHDLQDGVHDRLSVQLVNSCDTEKICCDGGDLDDFVTFYATLGYAIPWSNGNASFASGNGSCDSAPCGGISRAPQYAISSISWNAVETHGVGQAQAIANIKSALNQNQPVYFSFFMGKSSDWTSFDTFWDTQPESSLWSNFFCGQRFSSFGGGGHAILCVGYNDDGTTNSYWIMVNSWGTTAGRPNGLLHISMNLDYDCADSDGGYNLFWKTLNVQFDAGAPPNDDCAGAIALSEDMVSTMNTGAATDDTTPCLGTCSKAVWFTYTPDCDGTATVQTCGSDFDTKLEVLSGSCGSLSSIDCDDDSCGLQSVVTFPCAAGTTYYICAGGKNGASGQLQIMASRVCDSALGNDTCAGAIALAEGSSASMNTGSATDDTVPCLGTCSKGVWYTYTPDCTGTATVQTCGSNFDTKLAVFSGSCGALTSLGCNDDSCGLQSVVTFSCTGGTTYYICAGGYNGASGHLVITASRVCAPAPTRVIGLSGNLAFGIAQVGTTAQRTLTLSNSGNAALNVTNISYPAGFSGAWSGSVPAGGSHGVTVTFAPAAVIGYGGAVTVISDATSGTNTITASGTGSALPVRIIGWNDYDGDDVSDLAVYQQTTGSWYIRPVGSGASIVFGQNWGGFGLMPVSGDYDGDGVSDLAVYQQATGNWYIRSLKSATPIAFGLNWGGPGMTPIPGDFNGDGIWDLAVYQQATGSWYIRSLKSTPPIAFGLNWGWSSAMPANGVR